MNAGASIPFDRVAAVYDETRRLTPEASVATTKLLDAELAGRPPCLEIGVGTGLIALPLAASGIRLAGIDLSAAMLGKLVEKAGGRAPFPLVIGDATRLPFADGTFGGAYARHVLHLIADWRTALTELVRVVVRGGVLVINIGLNEGPWLEVGDRLDELVGRQARRAGLDFDRTSELDDVMIELGASGRELPAVWQESDLTLERYFQEVEGQVFSWTWKVDPERLASAVAKTKSWAADRFGTFDRVLEPRFPSFWRAYDLAGSRPS
jgi:ubiquinone/menaquinone biosynthesis C-methylase UbiE